MITKIEIYKSKNKTYKMCYFFAKFSLVVLFFVVEICHKLTIEDKWRRLVNAFVWRKNNRFGIILQLIKEPFLFGVCS